MAKVLNDYFAFVFTVKDIYWINEITSTHLNLVPLSDCDLTEKGVTKVLDKIKVNKVTSHDCIAPRVLKEAKNLISKPLAISFNKSINSERVPDIWKFKGDKTLPVNYRPISFTSVVGKLMETITRD